MYQALYRKWRPRIFDDVVGQEHITDTLKNQVKGKRLSHAYLFIGTRGTGKTSCAKIFAKAVNCESPENGNPCNKCRYCKGIDDGSILDVVELDAASNNGVDNVRALRDEAIFSPAVVKKRVYIVDEVHMLSTSAFNALLKILEEPPEHLMFILATTELHKVPATILSRCQRHSFKRINPDSIAKRLSFVAQQENMILDSDASLLLARLADGSLRDGLSLLDQCSGYDKISVDNVILAMGLAGNLRIAELLDSIRRGDTANSLNIFKNLWNDGKAPSTLLAELSALIRDILMIRVAPEGGHELLSGGFDLITLNSFSKSMSSEELIYSINLIQEHIGSLRDGRDPKTTAELCVIKLCQPNLGDSLDAIKNRVVKLEALLENVTVHSTNKSHQMFKKITEEREVDFQDYDESELLVSDEDTVEEENCKLVSKCDSIKINETTNEPQINIEYEDNAFDDKKEITNKKDKALESVNETSAFNVWETVLEELRKTLLPGQYNLISNSQMAKGEYNGESFVISVSDDFVKGQLEQTAVMNSVRNSVVKVMGNPVLVKIVVNKEAKLVSSEKLNDLTKFGNVKFE